MDEAILKPTTAETNAVYQQLSRVLLEDGILIPMCLPPTTTIAHTDISGIVINSFFPQIVQMQTVKRT
jgi:peptide/nickel transport system substrate-binding protein